MDLTVDFVNGLSHTQAVASASQSAGTVNSTGVDLDGLGAHAVVINVGALTGALDVKVQESDVVGSGYADISGAVVPQITAGSQIVKRNFRRSKRFCRVVATVTTGPVVHGVVFESTKRIV